MADTDYMISKSEYLLMDKNRDIFHLLDMSRGSWDVQKGIRDARKDNLRVRFDLGTR